MKKRSGRRVAVVLDSTLAFQRKVIGGIAAYAQQAGSWQLYVEDDPLEKLPALEQWAGDGLITAFTDRRHAAAIRRIDLPIVGVEGGYGWYDPRSRIPYFATDNAAIARLAADHLLAQGFLRLAYCGMSAAGDAPWSDERGKAFARRAREAGASCCEYAGKHIPTRSWNALQDDLCRWIAAIEKPVGIMAANDARARHVLESCHAVGVRVPEEVAVIGVDNHELLCDWTDPPLSSIEQGAAALGFQAAELLDRMMRGCRPTTLVRRIAPEGVIVRRSTDSLAIDDADVATAVRFIREHACRHIRAADVVDQVAVSRSTLEDRFKRVRRKTIYEEIRDTMLARAQELLADDRLPLKQVAREAGFAHVQHMTNVFRKRLGQTPARFRAEKTMLSDNQRRRRARR